MEPLDHGFRKGRAFGEALLAIAVCFPVAALVVRVLDPGAPAWSTAALPAALAAAAACAVHLGFRWRSRIRIGEQGIERWRTPRRMSVRLAWDEIDEIFLLERGEFEVRGAGKAIRYRRTYGNAATARDVCARRLAAIRDHLRQRALSEGQVVFRMPGGPWRAHLAYLAVVSVLTALTGLALAPLVKGKLFSFPLFFVFFGGGWIWGLRRKASVLGTRVTVRREGVVVQRLDRKDRVSWDDFDRAEWNEQDGLSLLLKSRRVISLPPSLGNIVFLEEFLREGRPSVDSGTTGGAENRTMIQS